MRNDKLLSRLLSPAISRRFALLFTAFVFFGGLSAARVAAQSALDGFDPNADGTVRAVVVQPSDGKIIIGGDFTNVAPNGGASVARNHIARFNPDGTLDTGFDPNASGSVYTIAVQSDGKILVGGGFLSVGGQARSCIARLDATTGTPDSFNPNANQMVFKIVVQPDGKILVSGVFNTVTNPGAITIGGQSRNFIARLDPTTGLADSFNPNAGGIVHAIAVQSDGKVLAGGQFTTVGGQARNRIARLDATTGAPDSFNPNADSSVFALAVQADGKILAGGAFTSIGGQTRNKIARLDPAIGAVDSFNPNVDSGSVETIALQPDGKILIGGNFLSVGVQNRAGIARLDAVTGAADSFYPNTFPIYAIAVQADGKIVVGGAFTTASPNAGGASPRNRVARFERDGRLDQTITSSIIGGSVNAIAIQPDGKILIGGSFTSVFGSTRTNIARLNSDGTVDTAFVANTNTSGAIVYAITVQPDGKILVGGLFSTINGSARNYIARLNAADGSLDSTFNPTASADNIVYAIALQSDGKILLGGGFSLINGTPRNSIARLDTTGTLDDFDPNPNAGFNLNTIAVQADGKILVGGGFSSFTPANNGGTTYPRSHIARLDPATGVPDSFDPNANTSASVNAISLQSNGKVLAGGSFTSFTPNGSGVTVTRNRVARFNADGTLDMDFDPNVSTSGSSNSNVNTITVQSDGKVLIGGTFNTVGVQTRNRFAQLNAATGAPDSFDPGVVGNTVQSIVIEQDGKLLLGGTFTALGGATRNRFGRLSNDSAAFSTLTVTKTSVTLTRDGAAAQLTRVVFEQSTDNGATYAPLGTATNSFAQPQTESIGKRAVEFAPPSSPTVSGYALSGLNLPSGQNILIRARGFYRAGYQNGSETIEDKVQNAFLAPSAPTASLVTIGGRAVTADNRGIRNVLIQMTDASGTVRTAVTSALGYYRFENIAAGETYILSIRGKSFGFALPTQIVNVGEDETEINFVAYASDKVK